MEKELVIIGSGPGGYVSAIKAAQLGLKVTLIEKEYLVGGTCLNVGCIPTKALLKSALFLEKMKNSAEFGIKANEITYDIDAIFDRKDEIVKHLIGGVGGLLMKNNVEVIQGKAAFKDNRTIIVNDEEVTFKNLIISAGSTPIELELKGIEKNRVIYSSEALNMRKVPSKMVIVGGGVIAVEIATIFNALGSDVTIVEMMPEILPLLDGELVANLKEQLKKKKINIMTNSTVLEVLEGGVRVKGPDNISELDCDTVLVAIGRKPNLDDLHLENTDIKFDKKGIEVNFHMQTNVAGIYAIGDVVPTAQLAHVASKEGIVAASNIAGQRCSMKYNAIPSCVFTMPEIASVGMTEEEAKKAGIDFRIGKFPLANNGRAMVEGSVEGLVKVIINADDESVLGVHILAPQAAEMIHQASLAISIEATIEEMASAIYPHPTVSEAVYEAAAAVKGQAIHL